MFISYLMCNYIKLNILDIENFQKVYLMVTVWYFLHVDEQNYIVTCAVGLLNV